MKKITSITTIIIFLVSLITVTLVSCIKESKNNGSHAEASNVELKSNSIPNYASVSIECSGTCQDADSECGAYWNIPEGRIECTCSNGCSMIITTDNEYGRSTVPRSDMTSIAEHFVDYIDRINGTTDYSLVNFKHTFYELAEFIEILYTIDGDTSEIYSIVYLIKFATTDAAAPPISAVSVDCHGSCDSSAEKCVEVYDTSTAEVYCKCESDNCKMTIEEL